MSAAFHPARKEAKTMTENEILVSEQVLQVPFVYSAGPVVSRFLVGLRDEGKFYGLRCGRCERVYLPPRPVCGRCFGKMAEWVEAGPVGTVENFTVLHYSETIHPRQGPLAIGLIRLRGADTCFAHFLLAGETELRIGQLVRPVFAEKRSGHILDLAGFIPEAG